MCNNSNVGGVGVYVRNTLSHCHIDAYKITCNDNDQIENI